MPQEEGGQGDFGAAWATHHALALRSVSPSSQEPGSPLGEGSAHGQNRAASLVGQLSCFLGPAFLRNGV